MGELKLMKGNEAIAEAAIREGVDAYLVILSHLSLKFLNILWQNNLKT